jgi:hypothetical protein
LLFPAAAARYIAWQILTFRLELKISLRFQLIQNGAVLWSFNFLNC